MIDFFLIHGAYGKPDGNWFPWLKRELERDGYRVFAPQFPTPEDQKLENWKDIMNVYDLDSDCILIGHSIGAAFILNLLEEKRARAAILVAGFVSELDRPEFDKPNKSFLKDFDWEKIRKNCSRFYVITSSNDPYVPYSHGEDLAEKLHTNSIRIKGAGHFNQQAGYDKFEQLMPILRSELSL